MKILDTEGKMYWLWHCLSKGKGHRNALCLSRLILSKVYQGGTFYVIGSTGLSVGVGSSAPWLAVPHRTEKVKTKQSLTCLGSVHELEKWSHPSASSLTLSWLLCTPTGKKAQRYLEGLVSKKISAECHINQWQRFSKVQGDYWITQLCWLLKWRMLLTQMWLRTVKAPLGTFRGFILMALPPLY